MRVRLRQKGLRGVVLVAVTYVYFLIFAQFAFLTRLALLNLAATNLKIVMAAMAAGGILLSLLAPRLSFASSPVLRLRIAFTACGAAALLSLLPLSLVAAVAVAFLIGAGLGLLTVTLVTHLAAWTGPRNAFLKVGLGTGIGYFLCNVPVFFTASPQVQSVVAALLCVVGVCVTLKPPSEFQPNPPSQSLSFSFLRALVSFAALVWLDSAAFFIIQHTASLKAITWMGSAHLWTNACLHLATAIAAALLLQRRRVDIVLSGAVLALAFACLLLPNPSLTLSASLFYPIGVSLYSVALVAFPSFLTSASSSAERGRQAGWIYAIAGWVASALGIGMGQNLGHVPAAFVVVSGAVVLLPACFHLLRSRPRELAAVSIAFAAAFALYRLLPSQSQPTTVSAIERGRQVYIAEGCIHCHSQYVRPNSPDVLMWGPVESVQQIHAQQPPLIGNRRQGPDLTQVGARRSRFWLKAHLIHPAALSGGSIMPSYAFLFSDPRGDDLVAYLAGLRSGDTQQQQAVEAAWRLSPAALAQANPEEGHRLYDRLCATCHDPNGQARVEGSSGSSEIPADLLTGPYKYLRASDIATQRNAQFAQVTRFGIPGTDMPGHEYLSDRQIASLTLWLAQNSRNIVQHP